MNECELIETCPFTLKEIPESDEQKQQYCQTNNLNCALYMITGSVGSEHILRDLRPDQKDVAYGVLIENS